MMRRTTWLLALGASAAPAALVAQAATGTITGRVVDRSSQRGIPGVNLVVTGTTQGTQTADDGTFRIGGVRPGTYTVRALRIGYSAVTRPVTVVAGQSTTVTFDLAASAVQLDVAIVTATGQTQRQRERGASIVTIDTSAVVSAATPDLTRALGARAPGVTVVAASGTTGTGSRIRIRGSNSLSLSNDPLLIVDGVRINSSSDSFGYGVGGQTISRFNDINPNDIESIDIIKGPAGVALYGTAAANGVIQIKTKQGRSGRAQWNAFGELGTLTDPYNYPANFANVAPSTTSPTDTATTANCNIDSQARGLCRDVGNLAVFDPLEVYKPYSSGDRQQYGLSAAGGGDAVTYRLGGTIEREQGIVANNQLGRSNFAGNLRAQLSPKIDAQLTTLFQIGRITLPQNENNAFGYLSAGLLGRAFNCAPGQITGNNAVGCSAGGQVDTVSYGYFSRRPSEFFFIDSRQTTNKFTGGLTLNYQPLSWLRGTLQGGADVLNRADRVLTPPNRSNFNTALQQGSASELRYNLGTYTVNGSGVASYTLLPKLTANTIVGGNYIREGTVGISAFGAVILPGTESLAGASARKDVGAVDQTIVTVAGYVRQEFVSADRRFLSFNVRTDNNSAFGAQSGYVTYPGVEASWVVSEEEFFPKVGALSQLRVRGAFGRSGQRPGFRQAQTFYSPVSVTANSAETPAAVVGGTGNVDLRPEITTEFEGGFEASLFNGRVGFNAGYFNKDTRDALVSRPLAPSLGLTNTVTGVNSQFVNLGRISNRGLELQANLTALDGDNVRAEVSTSFTATRNRVLEIGSLPPIIFNNGTQRHTVGYPAGSYFQRNYTFSDVNGDGLVSRVNCPGQPRLATGPACEVQVDTAVSFIGSPLPTREFNVQPRLTLFRNVRLTALIDYRGGFSIFNQSREFRCFNFSNCRDAQDRTAPLADQAKYIARAYGAFTDPTTKATYAPTSAGYIEKGDFTRLREVTLSLQLPQQYARRIGGRALSLTFAGQNLATWTKYSGFDPEINQAGAGANFTTVDFFGQAPLRRFTTRLNVDF